MKRAAKIDDVVVALAGKRVAIRANPDDGSDVFLSVRDGQGVYGEAWLSQRAAARLWSLLGAALGLSALIALGAA